MIEPSDDAWRRFDRRTEQAERKFDRDVESARSTGVEALGIDLTNPWERAEILDKSTRRASLGYFGSLLFFWLDELTSQQGPVAELRQTVNKFVVLIRKDVIESKWPPSPTPDWQERKEQEFDGALIKWLETRKKWREYEARILPELAAPAVPRGSTGEASTPLMYFLNWPHERLSADARRTLRSGLLEIHGARLDGTNDYVECCRRTYDLIAGKFDGAALLSEEALQRSIPEMVADASAGGGWSAEPMGRSEPTAIFNVSFGSQFYPPWRVEAFLESLKGRISHWSGRLELNPSSSIEGGSGRGRRPQSEEHKRVASKVASLGNDWKNLENPAQLAKWMDSEGIHIDKRSRDGGYDTWAEKCQFDPVNFVKAIEYRLRRARK